MKSDIIKTVVTTFCTSLFLLFVLPFYVFLPYKIINSGNQIYPFEIGVFRFIGTIPIFIGVLTFLWSAGSLTFSGKGTPAHFYPPEEFVATGLYRYVRNPMYVGGICLLVGVAILFESANIFIYALGMFVFFNLSQFQNVSVCSRSRKAKILTAGIHWVFRGLKFEPDAEIGQNGTF